MRSRWFLFGLFLLGSIASAAIPSAARADEAQAARQAVSDAILEALHSFGSDGVPASERQPRLRQLIAARADVPLIGQDILGRYWGKATAEQQTEFSHLVLDYIVGSWSAHLADLPADQRLEVIGDAPAVGGRVLVHSMIITPTERTPVEWTVAAAADGRPAIVDVSVEGVSPIQTMKADFTAVLRANGGQIEPLLEALRRKIASYQAASR